MKDKVLFVNHKEKSCGVYQYGERLASILSREQRYDVDYIQIDNQYVIFNYLARNNYKHIIVNWHEGTMYAASFFSKMISAPQSYIYHDSGTPDHLNPHSIFMSDMTSDPKTKRYALSRPIAQQYTKNIINKKEINIGSFGFGLPRKRFDLVCEKVKSEFENANINFHITTAKIADVYGHYSSAVIESCVKAIEGTNIKLNITTDMMSDEELAKFLQSNDINIFMYDNGDSNGLSSVIDHVVGAGAVFAVNSANMFSHVTNKFPELNIDNHLIKDIISLGNSPAEKLQQLWSEDVVRDQIYEVIYGNNR